MNKFWTHPLVIIATIIISLITLGAGIAYIIAGDHGNASKDVATGVATAIVLSTALCVTAWFNIYRVHAKHIDWLLSRDDVEDDDENT